MAPLRLSPFDLRARHHLSPLPLAAIIEHAVCAECPHRTLVQRCLIPTHYEQPTFTRLGQIACPVAQVKLTGFFRTPQQPSGNGHQDCRPNDRDASRTNPMVPGEVPEDDSDEADGAPRGGEEAAPPSGHSLSGDPSHNSLLLGRLQLQRLLTGWHSFATARRDRERERRAHAHLALHPDPPAVDVDE